MICDCRSFSFMPNFKSASGNSMAEFNQKNLSQISMIKMDDPYQIVGKKTCSKKSHSNFVYSYRPMYYFSRFFGLLPFSFVCDSSGQLQVPQIRAVDGVWFVFTIVGYIVLAINSCQVPEPPKEAVPLIYYSNTLLLSVGLFNGANMIVVNMCVRFKFVTILKIITDFDKEISVLGYHFNYKTAFILSLVCSHSIWLFSLLMIGFTLLNFGFYEECTLLETIGYYATCIVHDSLTAAPLVSFILLVCNLRKRFVALNNHLRSQFLDENNRAKPTIKIYKEDSINTVKFVGYWHSALTDTMRAINFCFSISVMYNAAVGFLFCVLTFYSFYRCILMPSEFKDTAIIQCQWLVYYNTYTVIILISSYMLKNEGLKTARTAHDIVNGCNDSDIVASLAQLSQQVHHYHPIATCGLFTLDWTLLFTMISATTTYLTILLTFEPAASLNTNTTFQMNF